MPHFMSLQTSTSREVPANTFIIDSPESMEQFFSNILQNNAVYDRIYLDSKMISAMKGRAKDLPSAYQDEFNAQYPGGMVGFTTNLSAAVSAHKAEIDPDDIEEALLGQVDSLVNGTDIVLETNLVNDLGNEIDDLTAPKKSMTFARNASKETTESSPTREFSHLPLIDQGLYKQLFEKDPFYDLARLIEMKDSEVTDLPGQSRTRRFKNHLDNIMPMVEFAMTGARHAWQDDETGNKEVLMQKMETFEDIYNLLRSMRVLASNKSRYTVEHYEAKLNKILESPILDENSKEALQQVLNQVVQEHVVDRDPSNFYQHKKGSTAFDASLPKQEIKGNHKRLTIEHDSKPDKQVVTGKFSYSRKDVIGVQTGKLAGIKKIFSQPKSQLAEMNAQVRDFVAVALTDYNKGTKENPIYLQPSKGNQSELCLAILLEFKQRAIIEGRELIAADDTGKRIKITPTADFSNEEKQYFAHFAMQVPKVKAKGMTVVASEHTAGYQLLKDTKMDGGKTLKDYKTASLSQEEKIDIMAKAMSSQLNDKVTKNITRHEQAMAEAVKPIREMLPPDTSNRARM